ncbi:alpha-N-acetylglucosaminidase TIM-barrel domain-containing protein [Amycolatopsis suaedae]|uniref:Alpha-N-acetylglucosaminidase n=1 Tax=Amycolatopsis suaedae TaxID=2510978 RepID=A0A4Q7JA21_9PSEU|nr:alpha-N-acetylglucosaminidase TIM-barrel domain-containing protein [Amycolatopsis suaedae]RZQ64621.1 alpha-N-acetylglucosaminidase [Amycolatopsis suaedae]
MRRSPLVVVLAVLMTLGLVQPIAVAEQAFDTGPAERALRRLVPGHADQVRLRAVPRAGASDTFRVHGRQGAIVVEGSSNAVLLAGFNAYLGEVGVNISWAGEQVRLPGRLPAPAAPISRTSDVPHRFALNDTNDGYTGPYWDWARWERELDVLALHGVNEVLVYAGQEAVYYDTFRRFGYSDTEIRAWIPVPAHQPWWLLQNMCCFPGGMSRQLIEQRAALGRRIVHRLRELGITPVLPGYFGTVPPSFADKNPGARVVPQGDWGGFRRPDWLDPRTAEFGRVAAAFYDTQRRRFGDSTMYKMDLLHEGGSPGDVPVPDAARAVERALRTARPGAIWVILGWQNNPRPEILGAVDRSRMLVVDGLSDRYPGLGRERDWGGTPYTFGSIPNFGGHTAIGANLTVWNERYWQWKNKPGSALAGIAYMPEAADNNPAAFDFFTSLAWRGGPADPGAWFDDWARRRYGGDDPNARAAWRAMLASAYAMPGDDRWSEPPDGLFGARPSLSADKASCCSPEHERYDTAVFDQALTALLAVRPELRDSEAYRYDLVDVARQVLSNRSRILLPRLEQAYQRGDRAGFAELSAAWLRWLDLLERVTSSQRDFLLGPWLEQARRWGRDSRERALLEYDVRSLLSVWGNRSSADEGLHDYANREWSGLISGLYRPRWERYLSELSSALEQNRPPRPIDWYAMEDAWARQHDRLPTRPTGDPHAAASAVLAELRGNVHQAELTGAAEPAAVEPGGSVVLTANLRNRNGFAPMTDVSVTPEVPPGATVEPLSPVPGQLPPGGRAEVRWRVTLPATAGGPVLDLGLRAGYRYAGAAGSVTASSPVLLANGVRPPLHTVSFNDAAFGQAGDVLAVHGGGADMWGGTNEFGAAYLPGGLTDGAAAEVTVAAQDRTGPWARAGLVVRDDLSHDGAAGYLNLAVTPSNGCVLTSDSDGDGKLDRVSTATGHTTPVRLRLVRAGNTYRAWCGAVEVGTATVPAAARQDVGAFMTAANGGSGRTGTARFTGFTVTAG